MCQHRSEGYPKFHKFSIVCESRSLYPFGTDEIKLLYMICVSHLLRDTQFAENGEE